MSNRFGYACINMQLSYPKQYGFSYDPVTTNRGMIKRTFQERGLSYAGELAAKNIRDLISVIKWNRDHNIFFYRMSSDMIPWASEYNLEQLPNWSQIRQLLKTAGDLAQSCGMRLTFHPGPFNALGSPNSKVVDNTFIDLSVHAQIMDNMGLSFTPYNKINIHIGGVYGDKQATINRWCEQYLQLPYYIRSRLTIENDDKASMYSVADLYQIWERVGVPIVFDYHHHQFCTGGLTTSEALGLATKTWPDDIVPVVHYSESRSREKLDESIKPQAHSDYIVDPINTFGHKVDIMVEAKMKELAIINYLTKGD